MNKVKYLILSILAISITIVIFVFQPLEETIEDKIGQTIDISLEVKDRYDISFKDNCLLELKKQDGKYKLFDSVNQEYIDFDTPNNMEIKKLYRHNSYYFVIFSKCESKYFYENDSYLYHMDWNDDGKNIKPLLYLIDTDVDLMTRLDTFFPHNFRNEYIIDISKIQFIDDNLFVFPLYSNYYSLPMTIGLCSITSDVENNYIDIAFGSFNFNRERDYLIKNYAITKDMLVIDLLDIKTYSNEIVKAYNYTLNLQKISNVLELNDSYTEFRNLEDEKYYQQGYFALDNSDKQRIVYLSNDGHILNILNDEQIEENPRNPGNFIYTYGSNTNYFNRYK